MLDSIYVGMTGLLGYSRGLRVIANNTANINTPGFKSASLQFADMFYANDNAGGSLAGQRGSQLGMGLNALGTRISFKQGELRQTGNPLDLAVDGQGLFVLRDAEGRLSHTRAGQFRFNADGVLVSGPSEAKVMGRDADGRYVEIATAGRMAHPGKPTSRVKFSGNLSSTVAQQTVGGIKVIDATGGEHTLSLKLVKGSDTAPGTWTAEVLDGTTTVGSGQIVFADGKPQAGSATLSFNYAQAGQPPTAVTLDFSSDVTSFAAGNLSTLATSSQDGVAPGALTGITVDAKGVFNFNYSNGETSQGAQLALARFDSPDAVAAAGDNQFEVLDERAWHTGHAGDGAFGEVRAGVVEISNVDLSQEFSDLVVMQRGYQASSQVISTANEMLQQLFAMKSR